MLAVVQLPTYANPAKDAHKHLLQACRGTEEKKSHILLCTGKKKGSVILNFILNTDINGLPAR